MKKELLLTMLFPFYALSQKFQRALEFAPIIRYDNYAEFDDLYSDRSYKTHLKLKGISWGIRF